MSDYRFWPAEHVELAKRLWLDGQTATLVAKEMNKVFGTSYGTGAIIGKIHRLKLTENRDVIARASRPKPRRKKANYTHQPIDNSPKARLARRRQGMISALARDAERRNVPVTLPRLAFLTNM
jgi:hypothetical protein